MKTLSCCSCSDNEQTGRPSSVPSPCLAGCFNSSRRVLYTVLSNPKPNVLEEQPAGLRCNTRNHPQTVLSGSQLTVEVCTTRGRKLFLVPEKKPEIYNKTQIL